MEHSSTKYASAFANLQIKTSTLLKSYFNTHNMKIDYIEYERAKEEYKVKINKFNEYLPYYKIILGLCALLTGYVVWWAISNPINAILGGGVVFALLLLIALYVVIPKIEPVDPSEPERYETDMWIYKRYTTELLVSPFIVPLYQKIEEHNRIILKLKDAALAYELYKPTPDMKYEASLESALEVYSENHKQLTELQSIFDQTHYISASIYEEAEILLADRFQKELIEDAFTEGLNAIQKRIELGIDSRKLLS